MNRSTRLKLACGIGVLFLLCLFSPKLNAQSASIDWLDAQMPTRFEGTTFGVPWPKGAVQKQQNFELTNENGAAIPVQTTPMAFWPDGSVKWTAVALGAHEKVGQSLQIKAIESSSTLKGIEWNETDTQLEINTGALRAILNKRGDVLLASLSTNGIETATNGKLVLLHQNSVDEATTTVTPFSGKIERIQLEQTGPIKTVVKVEGKHAAPGQKDWLPFVVRLYFYANSAQIRLVHTIIYDGDENQDFIKGLGIRFNVPLTDDLHNRHVRFVGSDNGVFAEAVKGLTGLRRPAGDRNTQAQIEGRATDAVDQLPPAVQKGLPYIPAFSDYTLFQPTPQAFEINKRTAPGYTWLNSAYGTRSLGTGYLGGAHGGMAFGIRNFWQSHPAQIDIRNAANNLGEVTLWLWAPKAQPMDLRFYHDGMGQDTYEKQWEGLEITYEDYEPGFGRPIGVARTSELNLWAVATTPSNQALAEFAQMVAQPPTLMVDRKHILETNAFGKLWTVRETASDTNHPIFKKLDWYFDYYKSQQNIHNWYGFWNYGDVMHSYDSTRHVWKYDIGGFAWDNSELSTDLWLWYYFLHSGRTDVFRMAEAMTRHTGEVDVHHLGPFAPLGSRHNVVHWGCSAKQMRISTAMNRRFFYYLTADERCGDLLNEQIEAHRTLITVPPQRKRGTLGESTEITQTETYLNIGTDWGALAAAWFTHWERTGDEKTRKRLENSMNSIAAQPQGFFSGGGMMNVETGVFAKSNSKKAVVSHLNAVFGLAEICPELIDNFNNPKFEKAWIRYCEFYNASAEEQKKALGNSLEKNGLRDSHSRLTAFAANKKQDPKLAQRAWNEFLGKDKAKALQIPTIQNFEGPITLNPTVEATGVSTNHTAQWCLSALQCISLIGMPDIEDK